jgi:hypothetical protein
VAALLSSLVGCGGAASVDHSDGRAVIQDALDGHLDKRWECDSLRAAQRRLPIDAPELRVPVLVNEAVAHRCATS